MTREVVVVLKILRQYRRAKTTREGILCIRFKFFVKSYNTTAMRLYITMTANGTKPRLTISLSLYLSLKKRRMFTTPRFRQSHQIASRDSRELDLVRDLIVLFTELLVTEKLRVHAF